MTRPEKCNEKRKAQVMLSCGYGEAPGTRYQMSSGYEKAQVMLSSGYGEL